MKILVLSDSHGVLYFMRQCVDVLQPDVVVHLGDMVRDADELSDEYPGIRFFQVAGNCDSGRVPLDYPEILVENLNGVRIYMSHGHRQGVKIFLGKLIANAQQCGADVILYGHTHTADCRRIENGSWIMNPGSAGYGSSAGLIQIISKSEITCKIIRPSDLEEWE